MNGRYRITGVIGAGGMGTVFAAEHIALKQRVAVKLVASKGSTTATAARVVKEARAAASIPGEHVVRVIDVDVFEDEFPYIVMEYLEGQDLKALLDVRGSLPSAEAVAMMLQACSAVAQAHAVGMVHRDLKPSNLFVTRRRDGRASVKVLDFGIAKWAQSDLDVSTTGDVLGSPAFMPPEQLSCPSAVDVRSDVWSLGATLYTMLAGRQPFTASTIGELCTAVLYHDPQPLSLLRPDLQEELVAVIQRCLEKSPAARWQSVEELTQALLPFSDESAPLLSDVEYPALHRDRPHLQIATVTRDERTDDSFAVSARQKSQRRRKWAAAALALAIAAAALTTVARRSSDAPVLRADPAATAASKQAAPSTLPSSNAALPANAGTANASAPAAASGNDGAKPGASGKPGSSAPRRPRAQPPRKVAPRSDEELFRDNW